MASAVETPPRSRRPTAVYAAFAALAFLALAGIAGVVIVYSTLSAEISDLERRATNAESGLRKAEEKLAQNTEEIREAGTAQYEQFKSDTETALTDTNNSVKTLNTKTARIQECLPELQAYIDGLSISTSDNQGYLTGAYLSTGQQVSRRCATMFRPAGPGD
jgi:Tfp pilus assembly protein PilX